MVHRGLEGLPDIPDGETEEIDQLVFVVHGIGAACDIKFRSITEVVDGFRELSEELSAKHFQSAQLMGKASFRVGWWEFELFMPNTVRTIVDSSHEF